MHKTTNIVSAYLNNLYYFLLFKSRVKGIFRRIIEEIKPGWNVENLLTSIEIKAFFSSSYIIQLSNLFLVIIIRYYRKNSIYFYFLSKQFATLLLDSVRVFQNFVYTIILSIQNF
jgi:hypothetical protein